LHLAMRKEVTVKPQDHRTQGILFLCVGVFIFTIQDAIIKQISGGYPVTEVVAIRSLVALPMPSLRVINAAAARAERKEATIALQAEI
jgi:hypothetical protein